VRLSTG